MPKSKKQQVIVRMRTKQRSKQKQPVKQQEVTRLGQALRSLGGWGGSALGGLIGMPSAGGGVGTDIGAAISRWLGSGDYTVSANSIVNSTLKGTSSIPSMHNNGQSVVIRHKEFVTEVRGSTAFKVQASFDINPGVVSTFPWLAGVAARFQEYKIRGLVWHYVPSSGSAVSSTNAALGTVMLQTSYRSNDSPPSNKMEVLNEYWSCESVPSDAFCHPIECDPKENPFNIQYIRTDAVPASDSKLLYDLGQTHLCVSGQQADDTVLGDLWCTYEIELKKPIVDSNVTSSVRSVYSLYTGTMTSSSFFNGSVTSFGRFEVSANGRTITFPPRTTGLFLVSVTVSATTSFTLVDFGGAFTYTNCSASTFPDGSPYRFNTSPTGTTNVAFTTFPVLITDAARQASVTLTGVFTGASTKTLLTVTEGARIT